MIAGAQLVAAPAHAGACLNASAIEAGEPAPCSGLVVPQVDALIALRCVAEDLPTCKADAKRTGAELAAEVSRLSTVLAAEQARSDRLASSLDMAGPVAQPRSTWTRTAIWSGTALVVGAVIGGMIVARVEGIGF